MIVLLLQSNSISKMIELTNLSNRFSFTSTLFRWRWSTTEQQYFSKPVPKSSYKVIWWWCCCIHFLIQKQLQTSSYVHGNENHGRFLIPWLYGCQYVFGCFFVVPISWLHRRCQTSEMLRSHVHTVFNTLQLLAMCTLGVVNSDKYFKAGFTAQIDTVRHWMIATL